MGQFSDSAQVGGGWLHIVQRRGRVVQLITPVHGVAIAHVGVDRLDHDREYGRIVYADDLHLAVLVRHVMLAVVVECVCHILSPLVCAFRGPLSRTYPLAQNLSTPIFTF